jgi:hypothetical protein
LGINAAGAQDLPVISCNGLYGTIHPLDSRVEYQNTEYTQQDGTPIVADMIITIGNQAYHIETQIDDDKAMALRIFEYDLAYGKRNHTIHNQVMILRFPRTRVIYLEPTRNTPEELQIQLEFPEGAYFTYRVKTFKLLDQSIPDLERQKLILLLPFYILKLRKKLKRSHKGPGQQELLGELEKLRGELRKAIEESEKAGLITNMDRGTLIEMLEHLQNVAYRGYTQEKEGEAMFNPRAVRLYCQEVYQEIDTLKYRLQESERQRQESEHQRQESERQRQESERQRRESERQRQELECKLREAIEAGFVTGGTNKLEVQHSLSVGEEEQ